MTETFWIGSSNTRPPRTMAPYVPERAAGIVCAGPRWIESSWSFASTRRNLLPKTFSLARGPFEIASLKASTMRSMVSLRYWIPFVTSNKMFVPSTATIPRPSSRVMPMCSSRVTSVFVSLNDFPWGISPSWIARTTAVGSGSTSK